MSDVKNEILLEKVSERTFLNKADQEGNGFIAYTSYPLKKYYEKEKPPRISGGYIEIEIADCFHRINLSFSCADLKDACNSIYKINILLDYFTSVRDRLEKIHEIKTKEKFYDNNKGSDDDEFE